MLHNPVYLKTGKNDLFGFLFDYERGTEKATISVLKLNRLLACSGFLLPKKLGNKKLQ